MRNHFDFVSSSRGYWREDETHEKNEIPCSGPEQDTPNRSILGRLFLHVILACFWPGSLPLAKKGQTIGPGQSLFSLSSSRERSERLVPRVNLPPQPSDLGFSCNLNTQRWNRFSRAVMLFSENGEPMTVNLPPTERRTTSLQCK